MTDGLKQARQIYIDANVCIYLVEGNEPFQTLSQRALSFAVENGIPLVSSELSFAECLYGAFKTDQPQLEPDYRKLFSVDGVVEPVPVELAILERAAKLGGESGLKLFDSIHMATAIHTGCDAFVTNDKRFRDTSGVRVVYLPELSA